MKMIKEMRQTIPSNVLAEAGVSKKELEQIQLLLEVDPNIFNVKDKDGFNLRPFPHHHFTDNPFNKMIDFT